MSKCKGLFCFIGDILESLRDSPLRMMYAFVCFILMIADYGVGAIPIYGDIFDVLNLLGAMTFQGENGELDFKNLILAVEFVPVVGDLLPIEAIIIFWTLWDDHKWLVIIMLLIGVVASVILLYFFGGFLGLW